MVHIHDGAAPPPSTEGALGQLGPAAALRDRQRLERHRAVLETALHILTIDGRRGLTMQRVADQLECSVGTIYNYFSSKDALLAEIQREALEILHASFVCSQSHLDALLAENPVEDPVAVLARIRAAATFWVFADETYPIQMDLTRQLLTDPEVVFATKEVMRILPVIVRLIEIGRQLLDDAVKAGVLIDGNNLQRGIVFVTAATGVTLISKLRPLDEKLFDGHNLAMAHVRDTLVGWGAGPHQVDEADGIVAKLTERGPIAPKIDVRT